MKGSRVEFDPTPTQGGREILPPSTKRTRVVFFPPQTGAATLSNESPISMGQGFVMPAGSHPIELSVEDNGECVQRSWFAVYSAGSTGIAWIQSLS